MFKEDVNLAEIHSMDRDIRDQEEIVFFAGNLHLCLFHLFLLVFISMINSYSQFDNRLK